MSIRYRIFRQETAEEKKDQLKTFVKQLQDANKTQQKRIDELTEMNKQQEVLIQSQKSALESKVKTRIRNS